MMDHTEAERIAWTAQATYLGADAALAAASWLTLSEDDARSVLDDIDPLVVDEWSGPNLSGEWADDPTPQTLTLEIAGDKGMADDELADHLAEAWEEGRDLVWWDAVQAYALRLLGDIPAALRVEQAIEQTATELRLHAEHLTQ